MGLDSRTAVSVARQPILDHVGHIFGYELLYRSSQDSGSPEDDLAGARVLTDAVLGVGLDALTCGLRAFVNLTHHLLIDGAGTLLPPENTVLQLPSDLPVTDVVIDNCKRLHDAGYAIALSDYSAGSAAEALLPWARFVKIRVTDVPQSAWRLMVSGLKLKNLKLIAEGVENAETATAARLAGFHLFQGFYFCKPTTFAKTPLPARRLAYLNLLAALNRDNLSLEEVENLVKHDVSLSYRVLRSVNSAAFGLHQEVPSIRRALVLLGVAQVRKWASVWSLAGLSEGGTPETVAMALVRARTCELIGETVSSPDSGSFFLLGMCSLLDVILKQDMKTALADMPLPTSISNALLGVPNEARLVLDTVIAYEQGSWDEAISAAGRAGIRGETLPVIYADALRWTRELSRLAQTA
jgi:EAL and modified HD-GYP domain-containing signal transduction protein